MFHWWQIMSVWVELQCWVNYQIEKSSTFLSGFFINLQKKHLKQKNICVIFWQTTGEDRAPWTGRVSGFHLKESSPTSTHPSFTPLFVSLASCHREQRGRKQSHRNNSHKLKRKDDTFLLLTPYFCLRPHHLPDTHFYIFTHTHVGNQNN